jgi:colanic acid/amylovoran biosynthesis protein
MQKENLKILLINIHSARNAGDQALTQITVQNLRKIFPGSEIILAMDDPESHSGEETALGSFSYWVRKYDQNFRPGWKIKNLFLLPFLTLIPLLFLKIIKRPVFIFTPHQLLTLIKAYFKVDLVVSKPGGFLYSSGKGINLLIAMYTMVYAIFLGKPLYVLPQTIGPLKLPWECWILSQVLSRARIVSVREPISLEFINKCGLNHPRLYLLPDPAFNFQGAPKVKAKTWFLDQGINLTKDRPILGMTVVNWGSENPGFQFQERYEDAYALAARNFVLQYGGKIILLPQVNGPSESQDDRIPTNRIVSKLWDVSGSIYAPMEAIPPDMLKAIYAEMDLLIGTRMHSNIFALSAGVPVIAIAYQLKTSGIMQMLDLGQWTVRIEQVQPETISKMVEDIWGQRDIIRNHLHSLLPSLKNQVNETYNLILEDYYNISGVKGGQ